MSEAGRDRTDYESLRASRRVLAGMVPLVQFGLLAVGVGLFLDRAGDLVSDMQLTWGERRVAGILALVTLGGFGLAGWVAGRLIRALAELIDVLVDQAEAAGRTADLIEWQMVPTLARVAVALERSASAPPVGDGRALAIAGVRQAIDDNRWEQAERLVEAFARDFPDAAEGPLLAGELAGTRQTIIDDLRARLDAARSANDPEAVIGFRDELTRHLRGDPLKDLDRQVIQWLMTLIQRRLRTGRMGTDVAELAAQVADSFGDTPEGASLRAALPTLRRSAGLCPRCARPYTGVEDACPACLASRARLAIVPATAPGEAETEAEP